MLYSLLFDEKIEKIGESVYKVLHVLNEKLARTTDGHEFGTLLVEAINKRETIAVFPLEVLNIIDVLKKVEFIPQEGKVVYNYNTEEWQKEDAQTE